MDGTRALRLLFVTEDDPLYVVRFFEVFLADYPKDEIEILRRYGIRNAFDLYALASDEARLSEIAQNGELNALALVTAARRVKNDPKVRQLVEFRRRLALEAALQGPDTTLASGNGADAGAAPAPTATARRRDERRPG